MVRKGLEHEEVCRCQEEEYPRRKTAASVTLRQEQTWSVCGPAKRSDVMGWSEEGRKRRENSKEMRSEMPLYRAYRH